MRKTWTAERRAKMPSSDSAREIWHSFCGRWLAGCLKDLKIVVGGRALSGEGRLGGGFSSFFACVL